MVNKKNIGDFCNVRCKAVTVWKHSFSFKFYSYGIENWYFSPWNNSACTSCNPVKHLFRVYYKLITSIQVYIAPDFNKEKK
jgi:hypothetical protein